MDGQHHQREAEHNCDSHEGVKLIPLPAGLGLQDDVPNQAALSPDNRDSTFVPISVPTPAENRTREAEGSESESDSESDDDEDYTLRDYVELFLRLAVIAGVICGFYFAEQAIGNAMADLRENMQKVPVWAFSLGFLLVTFVSFSFPPVYFTLPVYTISALFYGDAVGAIKGALLMKSMELINAAVFLVYRRFYAAGIKDLFETGETSLSRAIPPLLRIGLSHLDGGWRHWVLDQPWWKQLLVMVAMQTSFYMDDLITLLWLATRSEVSFALYCVALVLFIGADFARKVLQMETLLAATDALSSGGNILVEYFKAFGSMPTWQTVCIILFSVSSTVFVHGHNLFIIFNAVRNVCCRPGSSEEREVEEREFTVRMAEHEGHVEAGSEGAGVAGTQTPHVGHRAGSLRAQHGVQKGGVFDIENGVQRDGPPEGVGLVHGISKPADMTHRG